MRSYVMEDGRWCHKLHQSWLNTLTLCPERARLEGVGLMPELETDAASAGTAVHAAIETNLESGGLSLEDMVSIARQSFQDAVDGPHFEWKKYTPDQVDAFMVSCLSNWVAHVEPTLMGLDIQTEVVFNLPLVDDDQRVITLGGMMDVLCSTKVIDWKTNGSREYAEWEYKRWAVQPTMYTWAAHQLTGHTLPFEYVVMEKPSKRRPDGIHRFTVERGPEDWSWLAVQAVDAARLIELELDTWTKNDTHALCSPKWCPAWMQCKGAYVGAAPNW